MTIYNQIGTDYNSTRKADPYIAGRLYQLLSPKPGGLYLDIGCGTGNYLRALSDKGMNLYGVDPSEVMLEKARQQNIRAELIQANAECLPFSDAMFDGAIAVLTVHHWADIPAGLSELHRVLKGHARLVFFSWTPEQMRGYWLHHYFPVRIERGMSVIPDYDMMKKLLDDSGFRLLQTEKYWVQDDLQDHFLYSNKNKPERYLSREIRNNTSAFSLLSDPDELVNGLAALEKDIKSGEIHAVISNYENDLGDYLFLIAEKASSE